jgi:hypothetical protein
MDKHSTPEGFNHKYYIFSTDATGSYETVIIVIIR